MADPKLRAIVAGVALYDDDIEDCEDLIAWALRHPEPSAAELAARWWHSRGPATRSKRVAAAVLRHLAGKR